MNLRGAVTRSVKRAGYEASSHSSLQMCYAWYSSILWTFSFEPPPLLAHQYSPSASKLCSWLHVGL